MWYQLLASIVASELEQVAADAIRTALHHTTPSFRGLIDRFLADRNARIVFTAIKGLTGVGFPHKGSGRGAARTIGWEDIQHEATGTFTRIILDHTFPVGLWSARTAT